MNNRKVKEEYVKMKKERDYHRMHHNRVAQEKNKLITDIKRLKSHYETYEPVLKTMKDKYESAIRNRVVNQLERDRAVAELNSIKKNERPSSQKEEVGGGVEKETSNLGPTQKRLQEYRDYEKSLKDQLLAKDKSTPPKNDLKVSSSI